MKYISLCVMFCFGLQEFRCCAVGEGAIVCTKNDHGKYECVDVESGNPIAPSELVNKLFGNRSSAGTWLPTISWSREDSEWSPEDIDEMQKQLSDMPSDTYTTLAKQVTEKGDTRALVCVLKELNKNARTQQREMRSMLDQLRRNARLYKAAIGALGALTTVLGTLIAALLGSN